MLGFFRYATLWNRHQVTEDAPVVLLELTALTTILLRESQGSTSVWRREKGGEIQRAYTVLVQALLSSSSTNLEARPMALLQPSRPMTKPSQPGRRMNTRKILALLPPKPTNGIDGISTRSKEKGRLGKRPVLYQASFVLKDTKKFSRKRKMGVLIRTYQTIGTCR